MRPYDNKEVVHQYKMVVAWISLKQMKKLKETKPNSQNPIKTVNYFFNWDSFHARLNSHYKQGVTRKKGTKDTGNLFRKNLQLKDVCYF